MTIGFRSPFSGTMPWKGHNDAENVGGYEIIIATS